MIRIALLAILVPAVACAWKNGQDGNARTDNSGECSDPAYSTHDGIADRANPSSTLADVLHTFFLAVVDEQQ